MKISHEVLLAVSLLTVFLSNDIVATEMKPLLRIFRINGKIIRKDVSLVRKLYVFCLTYVYTHKIETSLAGVCLFTLAEIFCDSTQELFTRKRARERKMGKEWRGRERLVNEMK